MDKCRSGANGKIDYDDLSKRFHDENSDYLPPTDHIESKLLEFWSEILQTDNIGIKSHFISLGANSLNIMTLISKIHREFNTPDIPD